ncbi:hypothetical protein LZ30DRAFT_239632 [Colletotrichum cereale]|nr:hypothetical protein LZ30DRAFT_239632 [Colletotrichum cereale]
MRLAQALARATRLNAQTKWCCGRDNGKGKETDTRKARHEVEKRMEQEQCSAPGGMPGRKEGKKERRKESWKERMAESRGVNSRPVRQAGMHPGYQHTYQPQSSLIQSSVSIIPQSNILHHAPSLHLPTPNPYLAAGFRQCNEKRKNMSSRSFCCCKQASPLASTAFPFSPLQSIRRLHVAFSSLLGCPRKTHLASWRYSLHRRPGQNFY